MSSYERWTDGERGVLRENYGRKSRSELERLLYGRTWDAITSYAHSLGLSRHFKRWTEKENNVLRKNYATMSKEDLLKLLPDRTWDAIQVRAEHKLLLRRELASWANDSVVLDLTNFELGYLAGMIDGEGCITLITDKRRKNYRPLVYVSNTNMDIINYLKEILEPFGRSRVHDYRKQKKKPAYSITINRYHDAYTVLSKIHPFLKGKKRQAELILEFIDMRRYWRKEIIRDEKGRVLATKAWKRTKREDEICEEIHRLNHRGIRV